MDAAVVVVAAVAAYKADRLDAPSSWDCKRDCIRAADLAALVDSSFDAVVAVAALDSQPFVVVVHAVAFAAACCDEDEPFEGLEEASFAGPFAAAAVAASSFVGLAVVQQGVVGPCSMLVVVVGELHLAVVVVVAD